MDSDDLDLTQRLIRLEASVPAVGRPPILTRGRRAGRFAVSLAMAPALALAMVATAVAGAVVVANLAEGRPGIQNPGQPLAGAGMECMSPPDAAAFLTEHGFDDVVWQVESGSLVGPDGGKGDSTSVQRPTPPSHGFVIPGSLLGDGSVIMVVDQRIGATGVGACHGMPMP